MSVSCERIAALVTKIQNDFLDRPGLRLTLSEAHERFGADEILCEAILGALVDSRVLARGSDGSYIRFFPGVSVGGRGAHVGGRAARTKMAPGIRRPIADFAA